MSCLAVILVSNPTSPSPPRHCLHTRVCMDPAIPAAAEGRCDSRAATATAVVSDQAVLTRDCIFMTMTAASVLLAENIMPVLLKGEAFSVVLYLRKATAQTVCVGCRCICPSSWPQLWPPPSSPSPSTLWTQSPRFLLTCCCCMSAYLSPCLISMSGIRQHHTAIAAPHYCRHPCLPVHSCLSVTVSYIAFSTDGSCSFLTVCVSVMLTW